MVTLGSFLISLVTGCAPNSETIGVSRAGIQFYFAKEPWGFQFIDTPVTDNKGRLHVVGVSKGIAGEIAPSAIEIITLPRQDDEVIAVMLTLEGLPPVGRATGGDALTFIRPAIALGKLVTPEWEPFEFEFLDAFGQVFTSIIPETNKASITYGNLKYEFGRQNETSTMYLLIQHK